jgi:hypothetical protein
MEDEKKQFSCICMLRIVHLLCAKGKEIFLRSKIVYLYTSTLQHMISKHPLQKKKIIMEQQQQEIQSNMSGRLSGEMTLLTMESI